MIKQKSLGGKHDKKNQKQADKNKDKRINKDEKRRKDSLQLRNTETVKFWKEGGERCRSLLYYSFYSFVKQGQPHLLIYWNNIRINSPSVQHFQSLIQKHHWNWVFCSVFVAVTGIQRSPLDYSCV